MKEKLPYVTQNRALAIALHFGGCRIVDIWRVYSPQELEQIARDYRIDNVTATTAAFRDIGGKVQIFLEDGPKREKLEEAFDSVGEIDKLDIPKVSDEDAARIVHLVLTFRKQIERWLRSPACAKVIEERDGEPTVETREDGTKYVTHPGLTVHSGNASKTIIDHLAK